MLASMRNESDSGPRHRVVLVASSAVPLFELAIPAEVFGVDRREIAPDWYDFTLVAADGPSTAVAHGFTVPEGHGLAALRDADTVIVPACASVHTGASPALLDALRQAHARGARIAAICSGAFVLAEAGLLDGRRATTHWMHARELAERYPAVAVDPAVLYVHDDVWTSAGSAAGLDMCLHLVRCDFGAAVANEVARRMVVPPHRDGGQAQYIRLVRPARSRPDTDLQAVQSWARRRLADVSVAGMAVRAGLSTRTLNRRFTESTGQPPQVWLQRVRLDAAAELLETTDASIDSIARWVGLGTASNLRERFTTAFGVPPSAYRRTFGPLGSTG